jgi:hypothetical protein
MTDTALTQLQLAAPSETSSFVWWCVNATALTIDGPDSVSWSLSP